MEAASTRWRWRAIPAPPGFMLLSLDSAFNCDVPQSAKHIGLTPLTMFVAREGRTVAARLGRGLPCVGAHTQGTAILKGGHYDADMPDGGFPLVMLSADRWLKASCARSCRQSSGQQTAKALQINGEAERPTATEITATSCGEHAARILVRAASLNAFDCKITAGGLQHLVPIAFPCTLGTNERRCP